MRRKHLVENLALVGTRVGGAEGIHRVRGGGAFRDEALGNDQGQVDDALRVAPFVVVPGDNLDHVVTHHHGEGSVNGRGDVSASEIDRHERGVGDSEDALHRAIGGFLEGSVDFFGGETLLFDVAHKVNDGDVRGRHAKRDTVELTLELREHERDSLGGTGGGRHDVQGGGTGAAQVTVGRIEDALVTSVRVGGGHGTLDDAELVIENLGERREAVRGARRVGNNVRGGIVLVGVDTDDVGRDVRALGRGGDDNLLGASLDVLAGTRTVKEHTGTFNDDVDAHFLPRQVQRVTVRDNLDDVAVDRDGGVIDHLDVRLEGAQDGVILEQVRRRLGATGLVDAHDLERAVRATGLPAADKVATCEDDAKKQKSVERTKHGDMCKQ